MNDYISRDAVFDWFCESADIDGCVDLPKNNGSCKKGCRHCISGKELDEIPTADVRENVHAHWEGDGQCSNCKDYPLARYMRNPNFCPNCGAQMDEEELEITEEDWHREEWMDEWSDNGFCYKGERREE